MFRIQQVTSTSTFLKSYFLNALTQLEWRPGEEDVECFLSCDPTGLYVGEINGKPIGTVSILKYGEGYCHFDGYIVEKEYRKQGFGRQLFDTALKKSAPVKNLSLYAVPEMVAKYEASLGAVRQWSAVEYEISLPKAIHALQNSPVRHVVEIKRTNEVDLQALYDYDTSVFGYKRHPFVNKWLHAKGAHARVAIDRGVVVGYIAVRPAFNREEGYRVGPLFSNSMEVAKSLLQATFEEIREQGISSSESVFIECPEINKEAKELITLLKGRSVTTFEYMTTNGLPRGHFNHWYAITLAG
ncbi:hypothetical protein QZH41_006109 [Actinostola sp. cb2023]|nr:hypothetical protein QZH41_006109 [Actinostola sp. cb2023]